MTRHLTLTACAVAALFCLHVDVAQAKGRYHGSVVIGTGGYYGNWYGGYRPYWGGVGVGVAIGAPYYYPYRYAPYYGGYGYGYGGYGGSWVVPAPVPPAAPVAYAQPVPPAAPMAPAPTLVPRNGQSAAQTDLDRRECDRWAVSQPAAMADAQVFHRITLACMDARGYSAR